MPLPRRVEPVGARSAAQSHSMAERSIPIADLRAPLLPLPVGDTSAAAGRAPLDRRQRPLRDLRISVTDRCNFRCG